jgi:hypothetical protein
MPTSGQLHVSFAEKPPMRSNVRFVRPKIRTTNFLHAGSSYRCKVRWYASDLRIRRDIDAVPNDGVRPVSTAGEGTRQPT